MRHPPVILIVILVIMVILAIVARYQYRRRQPTRIGDPDPSARRDAFESIAHRKKR